MKQTHHAAGVLSDVWIGVYLLSLQTLELESLLIGLEQRLPQLEKDVSVLEKEDDGELYAVLSLHVIENELEEIKQLVNKLNSTTLKHQDLTTDTTAQVNSHRVMSTIRSTLT